MRELELQTPREDARIGVVAASFNRFITSQLVAGLRDAFARHGLEEDQVTLAWVPGAFELPLAADRMLATGRFDAVVALGAVIRGATPHFDYVAGECANGLGRVALRHGKPAIFGVLTTDTVEQAMERAGAGDGNKGYDAAMAALHMLGMLERIDPDSGGA